MQGATVATTSTRALLAACDQLGLDTAAMLKAVGLLRANVEDPDGRIPGQAVAALWQDALARSGNEDLPLRVAEAVPFGAYRVIDFLAASAPTVGEGLARVARYFPLINSAVGLHIAHGADLIRVGLRDGRNPAGVPRPYAEFVLAVTVLHCRRASGVDWPLHEVHFGFPKPARTALHEKVFGCPVSFLAAETALILRADVWNAPSASASSDLLRVLEQHAEGMVSGLRQGSGLKRRVMQLLHEELRGADPSLANIARRLAMSARTVQRRLHAEGSSFADVLDETRKQLAAQYLDENAFALTEIAHLLGFSEQSAFTRAFQRWYGMAPSRFRRSGRLG